MPRSLVVRVIKRADGVYCRVRGWWVVPFDFVVPGEQLVLHADQTQWGRVDEQ
ncbi:hypothetical protein [Embleya sp. AB8]|uniref:hypothetical protein n=1 Tax=Embleya sp. AB8 TaxID=3156304 RepID=UPI003C78E46C